MSLGRHTAYNLAGWLVPVLVSLITVPFYLRVVGLERYGLLALFWTIVGSFGFVGLGMGPAVAQRLAADPDATGPERSRVFWSAAVVSIGMALIGAPLLLTLAGSYFRSVDALAPALRMEVLAAIPWLSLIFMVGLASGVPTGVLQARQWFGLMNGLGIVTSTANALLPLLAALVVAPTLQVMLMANFAVSIMSLGAMLWISRRAVPLDFKPSVSAQVAKQLLKYGGWTTVTSILAPLTMLADRLLIGTRLGPAAVSVYVVPYNLASRIVALPASLSSASLPKLASAQGDKEQALLTHGLKFLLATLMPICVGGNLIMGPFLRVWVGEDIASEGTILAAILLFGFWMHGVGHIPSTVLQARGRPDVIAKLFICYVVIYIPLLFVLLTKFKLLGVAFAWAIRASLDLNLFFFARTGSRQLLEVAGCSLLVLASSVAAATLDWRQAPHWAVLGLMLLLSIIIAIRLVPAATWTFLRAVRITFARLRAPDDVV